MNQTTPSKPKRNTSMQGAKVILASLGVTSILGFWTLLSRQTPASPASGNTASGGQNTNSDFLSSLPPIATLVPLGNVQAPASLSAAAMPAAPAASSGPIFMGGSKPSSQPKVVHVVTRTRSS